MCAKTRPTAIPARAARATPSAISRRRPRRDTTYQQLTTQISRPAVTMAMASRWTAMPMRDRAAPAISDSRAAAADIRSPGPGRSAPAGDARVTGDDGVAGAGLARNGLAGLAGG